MLIITVSSATHTLDTVLIRQNVTPYVLPGYSSFGRLRAHMCMHTRIVTPRSA